MVRSYSKRDVSEYNNPIRKFCYWFVTKIFFMSVFYIIYRLEVNGRENIPEDTHYIVAPNHLSTLDPPLMGTVFKHFLAFMAKQELFDNFIMRILLDILGAFAVNREHLAPSTIKTAKALCNSNWVLGLFPEGTRGVPGKIGLINQGFTTLAKISKCGILPVGIIGTDKKKILPFTGKIIVNVGKIIPYNDDLNIMADEWIKSIQELTGFKYEGEYGKKL